jgi:Response regulator containing CheY-like receiver domain and AraC-type DNA-binding domain
MTKLSMYTRMVVFGCAVCIIPILAVGFFSYMKSSASIQNHVSQSSIQLMRQSKDGVEQVLRTVDYTLNYVINTKQLQEALYRPLTFYDFQLYNELKQELNLLQSPDTKVTDVILANAEFDWLINNQGLYAFSEHESRETLERLMDSDVYTRWVLLETGKLGSSDTQSYACPHTIALIKKLHPRAADKRGIALATIPGCSLAEMIDDHTFSREMMVLAPDYTILIHADLGLIGKSLTNSRLLHDGDLSRFDAPSGQFETKLDNRPISVTYVRSDFNGWIYVSFTEMSAFKRESRQIGWFTLYVCGVILLLSILFVWVGSRRVYSPIRQIFEQIAQRLPESAANTKNELQVIHEQIHDLFASNSRLQHELRQNSRQMLAYFLHKLYLGQIHPAEIREKLAFYGIARQAEQWDHMSVFTLRIDALEQTRYSRQDADLLMFAIANIIEEMVPPEERLPSVMIDQTLVTLTGRSGISVGDFSDYVYKLTEEIQNNMRRYLDLEVSIGISLPFQNLTQAARAYQEGLEALKHRLILGEGVIIPYFSINAGKHTRLYYYPNQLHHELIDAIKLADEARAFDMFDKWLDEVFMKERSPDEYQISLIRLLNDIMMIMQEAGISLKQLHVRDKSLYEELLQLHVRAEIGNWFKTRLIRPIMEVFRERQHSQYQKISDQIIEIIRNEYDTNLTLEACAERLHYNTFYLSSVFKKETQMSFSDYLTQYRLNMSKRWLVETDMSIKEIAERLTYNNPQNFIRFFRKMEGMTPGQYRSKYAYPGG